MKAKLSSTNYRWIIFGLFFSILAYIYFRSQNLETALKTNHSAICATIESIYSTKAFIYEMKYSFTIENRKVIAVSGCNQKTKEGYESGIDKVLVIFNNNDPDNSRPLENLLDFRKYNISFKDTIGIKCE